MNQFIRSSKAHKYPVPDYENLHVDLERTLRMGLPHTSPMEQVGLSFIGDGIPSTMVRYLHQNFKEGRAYKLKSALRGEDSQDDPIPDFMWRPKTKHRPILLQNPFPALTSGGGGGSNVPLKYAHPWLRDGGRTPNSKLNKKIGMNKGSPADQNIQARQAFSRMAGYRSIGDVLPIQCNPLPEEEYCPCHSQALDYAGDYITANHRPYHHDQLIERKLVLDNDSVIHRKRAQKLGLVRPGYRTTQSVMV